MIKTLFTKTENKFHEIHFHIPFGLLIFVSNVVFFLYCIPSSSYSKENLSF